MVVNYGTPMRSFFCPQVGLNTAYQGTEAEYVLKKVSSVGRNIFLMYDICS